MSKIIIRRRFPNFICDGKPLGPEDSLYLHELDSTEDFFEIDWVKEKEQQGITSWSIVTSTRKSGRTYIIGNYGDGEYYAFAWIVEGELDLPEFIEE